MSILKSPRNGYKEVKSDTARLWVRDLVIQQEKKKYEKGSE